MESKTSPALGLLGVINIDLSGLAAANIAVHVLNTAAMGPVIQVTDAAVNWPSRHIPRRGFALFQGGHARTAVSV
jgi:hypothetical protein